MLLYIDMVNMLSKTVLRRVVLDLVDSLKNPLQNVSVMVQIRKDHSRRSKFYVVLYDEEVALIKHVTGLTLLTITCEGREMSRFTPSDGIERYYLTERYETYIEVVKQIQSAFDEYVNTHISPGIQNLPRHADKEFYPHNIMKLYDGGVWR